MESVRRRFAVLTVALALAGCATVARDPGSADRSGTVALDGPVVLLDGRIDSTMAAEVERLAASGRLGSDGRVTADLNSIGGHPSAALRILRALRAEGRRVEARVGPGALCASACTLLFSYADSRRVAPDAKLWVHGTECLEDSAACRAAAILYDDLLRTGYEHASPALAALLDAQEPPALARHGDDHVEVAGEALVALGAATPTR